jgi:hypothetical protein
MPAVDARADVGQDDVGLVDKRRLKTKTGERSKMASKIVGAGAL